ncbi:endo alpha-1,4 polygalactosaminidase [Streptomyces typhae]|uniref:endo alpha-1,4 polygalactosaminidase n=1 Tax=Streptomyces typhae TaxID=2681492 RepID=UPI0018DF92BB
MDEGDVIGSGATNHERSKPQAAAPGQPRHRSPTRPTTSRPTTSRPTAPRPTSPRPTAPRPTSPRPTTPRPTAQRPTAPRPTGTRPTSPRPTVARLTAALLLLAALATPGCSTGDTAPDAPAANSTSADPTPDTPADSTPDSSTAPTPDDSTDPAWWAPEPGEITDWDWQISEPYDLSAHRQMYDIDLFDLAPEGSELRYDDGTVIDVPAGPLAGRIDELHARRPRPVVICYVDTGAYEHYRPDAARFPGHEERRGAIPNRPHAPAAGSVVGWDTGWEGERWLDIRKGSRGAFAEAVWARFDLAERMGCDGVEPDQNNPRGNDPGFRVPLADQLSWYREVARQAHARGLSVGMKNGHNEPGTAARLVDSFDWALPEECVEFDECGELEPFVAAGKAVFAVDYRGSVGSPAAACRTQARHGLDGLIKGEPPTGSYRRACGQKPPRTR